jgi:SET domain-containing protein
LGLFANEDIAAGDFVIEYGGEIIDDALLLTRKQRYQDQRRSCLYFMKVPQGNIDAMTFGNEARFINHSCDPNCEKQKMGGE